MFGLFKKKEPDPDSHMFERWETRFGLFGQKRFQNESGEGYEAYSGKGAYWMELQKKNVFAWVIDNYFKYGDFVAGAELVFDEENGHSAAGFILRYINNENFYSFLIAKNGTFRFDVLFNGNPLHLIEWTKSPYINPGRNEIMAVARGHHFSFYVDNEWIAEFEDDTIDLGRLGLAAQNYNQKPGALFRVNSFSVDSRSLEVEKAYYRWTSYVPINPEQRILLARTLFSMEKFQGAAVQLKKAFKHKKPTADEHFLFAECLLQLELYADVPPEIEKCLQLNPGHSQARLEKANLLYLLNRFIEARDYINKIIEHYPDNAVLLNILGNCEYSLGNFAPAMDHYKKAVALNPDMPLFYINGARCAEKIKDDKEALKLYLGAARLAFKQENYQDLSLIVPRITVLDPHNQEVTSIQAKMLYHEDKKAEAKTLFQKLIADGYVDSTIFFLYALILIGEDKREEAYTHLLKATELEKGYPLYWFRLAETGYILGKDPVPALKKAYELDKEDAWINNLYGLYYSDKDKLEKAEGYLAKAYARAGGEQDIVINLSDVLFRLDKKQEAYALMEKALADSADPARLINHKANLLSREARYGEAVSAYEKALALDAENSVIMENLAAACIEADQIMRANELLVKLVDSAPSASVYNKLGNVALIRGEYRRAELCFNEGLALEPGNPDIKINLAVLFGDRLEYIKAKALLEEVLAAEPKSKRASKIFSSLRTRFEKKLHCAGCGREWWVPKELPTQEALKLHGEPLPESPAGKCKTCGKIYCVACAQKHMKENRFTCPNCNDFLKLSDDHLRYLVMQYVNKSK